MLLFVLTTLLPDKILEGSCRISQLTLVLIVSHAYQFAHLWDSESGIATFEAKIHMCKPVRHNQGYLPLVFIGLD